MGAVLWLLNEIIWLYTLVLIIQAVLSWLIAFNVVNTYNRFVYSLAELTNRLTEPVLRPIRNILPNLGGIDISPVIAILLLQFLAKLLNEDLPRYLL